MDISVVIATYNRADIIPVTLKHLARQTLASDRFEVIVVNDGSTDATDAVIDALREELPFQLVYLKHENRGPGYTQNRGIMTASASLICLIADDILLVPEALDAFLESHRQHPEPNAAFLGKVLQAPLLAEKSVFLKNWDPFKFNRLENSFELPYYLFWACNISFKKEFMRQYGMFRDEIGRAGAASHEDAELGYRLFHHGLKLYYNKGALGHHFHVETLDGACRRAYQRGKNWRDFRALVDDPCISVRYHILNSSTLKDHVRSFTRGTAQIGADANLFSLFAGHVIRFAMFNAVTVPFFWIPVMRYAERNQFAARCMHTQLYRGAIFYHFLKGVDDGPELPVPGK